MRRRRRREEEMEKGGINKRLAERDDGSLARAAQNRLERREAGGEAGGEG